MIDSKNLLQFLKDRESCDSFLQQKIEKDDIDKIIEAGRNSVSFKNRQPWRFVVIDDDKKKMEISEICGNRAIVENAGVIIAFCSTLVDFNMKNGFETYPMDLSFACSFMMLQAESMGFSTKILGTFEQSSMQKYLSLPFKMKVPLLLLVGHKDKSVEYKKYKRKATNEIVSFNHW